VGAMATLSRQSLPFWWDDVADMSVLEKVTVDAFNKVRKNYHYTKFISYNPAV
jgi:hypothetical protein